MTKEAQPAITTPVGRAAYAWLSRPDTRFTKKDLPIYKVTLLLQEDDPSLAEFQASILAQGHEDATQRGIRLKKKFSRPWHTSADDIEPREHLAGLVRIEAKTTIAPSLRDSANQPLAGKVDILSGDLVRMKVLVRAYEPFGTGMALKLIGVQLIQQGPRRPSMGDFEVYEGGFKINGS